MAKGQRLEAEISVKDSATQSIEKVIRSNEKLKNEMLRLKATMDKVQESAKKRWEMRVETAKANEKLEMLADAIDRVRNRAALTMERLRLLGSVIGTALGAGVATALKSGADLEKYMISMEHFIGVQNKGMSTSVLMFAVVTIKRMGFSASRHFSMMLMKSVGGITRL